MPTTAAIPVAAQPRLPVWLMAVLLVLVTLALYWPATGFDFINYDDPGFVASNVHVQGGLKWEGVKWAFGLNAGDYWHPLTWLSLMLDASLFGSGAGGFHFTSVAFHASNGVLLFLLLQLLTGTFWRSVLVAALFALHPLRVESVAWVTERKDVLSGFFGLVALIAYARYAEKLGGSNQRSVFNNQLAGVSAPSNEPRNTGNRLRITDRRLIYYSLSLFSLALGLMSKAMLVTWPFVMLLLDYWPLRRYEVVSARLTVSALRPLVREKIPFFILSGISCAFTYLTEKGRQDGVGVEEFSALLGLENAFAAYTRYLGKTFWPAGLAVPYVNPGRWSGLEVAGSVVVVAGVCLLVFWLGRRRPYLPVGWFWFIGTLIPVIGLTKGWGVFMADRFTYVPSIGVLISAIWGVSELTRGWRHQRPMVWIAGGMAMVLCLALTRQQIGYWKDGESLSRHALELTESNQIAHKILGDALAGKGQTDEAIREYQEALRLNPDEADTHNNLGMALAMKGLYDEAINQFQQALRRKPDHADAHYNFGAALEKNGQVDEALRQFQETLRLKPEHVEAHYNYGIGLARKGQTEEALRQFQETLRLKPEHVEAHCNYGIALARKGQIEEALRHFQEAVRLRPDYAQARYNLGIAFAVTGQTAEAIRQFQEALRFKPDYVEARKKLDILLASRVRSSQPSSASPPP